MKTKALILALYLAINNVYASSSNDAELRHMLALLREHTELLQKWSERNQEQNAELLELTSKSSERNDITPNKDTWEKVNTLNQKSRLLLEACADTVDEYKSIGNYLLASERSQAWTVCQQADNCDFYKVTQAYDRQTLELAQNAYDKGALLGENLQEALAKLDAFSSEAQNAEGLNSSIDTLSKVSSMTANSIITLTSEMHSLLELSALNSKKDSEKELLSAVADENFLKSNNISSEHLSLKIADHVN